LFKNEFVLSDTICIPKSLKHDITEDMMSAAILQQEDKTACNVLRNNLRANDLATWIEAYCSFYEE
jgi:hypothetical protein